MCVVVKRFVLFKSWKCISNPSLLASDVCIVAPVAAPVQVGLVIKPFEVEHSFGCKSAIFNFLVSVLNNTMKVIKCATNTQRDNVALTYISNLVFVEGSYTYASQSLICCRGTGSSLSNGVERRSLLPSSTRAIVISLAVKSWHILSWCMSFGCTLSNVQ